MGRQRRARSDRAGSTQQSGRAAYHGGQSMRIVAVVAIALAVAVPAAKWARSPVVYDDAYISYRYADNLVRGHGLVFNPGERVEGYSNFLWVMLAAGATAAAADPLTATRAVGVLA